MTDRRDPRRPRRIVRRLVVAVAVLAVLAVVLLGGAGWYFAGEISSGALEVDRSPRGPVTDTVVESVADGRAVLRHVGDADGAPLRSPDTYGLVWDGGVAVVSGPAEERDDGSVVRAFDVVDGTPPAPGTEADLRGDVWPDPRIAHGVDFEEVDVPCAGGSCPAWEVAGDSSTWMILVHGKGASRTEPLRALGVAVDAGLTGLVISYRNDPGVPPDPSGRHAYGATEWRDLEDAVRYARDRGAEDVVLFGASMGGAIVAAFLERSAEADAVRGVVLDSPMLDLDATVVHGAAQRSLPVVGGAVPDVLTGTAQWIAGWRYDLDWEAVDYLPADWLTVPALVFHGTDDDLVPISVSDEFAADRPDLVTAVRVEGAEHVRAWNADPAGYERRMTEFVACVTAPRPDC